MAKTSNNGLALCVIIIVVVGLFLHYEMGYNLDFFSVGGKKKRHKWWHHLSPRHYNKHSYYVETHPHPQNITLDKSGGIEEGEFNSALDGDLGSKINDGNKYTFTSS